MKYKKHDFMKIGKRIKDERKILQLSLPEMSEKIENEYGYKISRQALSDIEKGNSTRAFTVDLIDIFCEMFGCDGAYLLCEYDDCKTYNNQFIHDKTGLSQDAISKLTYHNRQMHYYIESLNILLSSANFTNALYYINKYIKSVKLTDGFAKIRRERYEEVFSNPPDCGDAYNWPHSDNLDEMYTKSLHEEELSEYNIDTYFRFVIKELARLAGRKVWNKHTPHHKSR